jgi:hypothetical protein
MLSDKEGWAVGSTCYRIYCYPASVHWDGTSWSQVSVPSSLPSDLDDVATLSATDAWAVGWSIYPGPGDLGAIMHWNGTAWTGMTPPVTGTLRSIDMLSPTDGWAAGPQAIMHWDGSTWSTVATPQAALTSISMVAHDDGWAVGNGGIILHWDGSYWSLVNSPTTLDLDAVDAVSAQDAWAAGGNSDSLGIILHWDGSDWHPDSVFPVSKFMGLSMLSEQEGYVVGYYAAFEHYTGLPERLFLPFATLGLR